VFSVGLAERYGPVESIILSNICWWVETNRKNGKHFYDGRFWTYGSAAAFERIFTYLKPEQIKYTLRNLRERGALLTGNYNKMRYDRTLWYTVSDDVMAVYECRRAGGGEESPPSGAAGEPGDEAGERSGADKEEEGTGERSKERFHCGNFHNGSGKKARSIVGKPTIHRGNFHDGLWKFPPPIPFININKKAAAAEDGGESGKTRQNGNEAEAGRISDNSDKNVLRNILTRRRPDLVFEDSFYRRALEWVGRRGLAPAEGYVDWLLSECETRKPDNLRGLFYTLFFADDMADLYKAREIVHLEARGAEESAACPACGEVHAAGLLECPRCGFKKRLYGNPGEVERQKRINEMTPEVRREYEREIKSLFFSVVGRGDSKKWLDLWTALEKKYHLIQ
jgi:hypothetical protein